MRDHRRPAPATLLHARLWEQLRWLEAEHPASLRVFIDMVDETIVRLKERQQ